MSTELLRRYLDIISEETDDMRAGIPPEPASSPTTTTPAPTAGGPLKVPKQNPSTEWLDIQKVIQALYPDALPEYGADGYNGPETKAAVEKFQTDNKLNVDGLVGNQTITALNQAIADKKIPFKPSSPTEIAAPNQQPGDWKKGKTTPTTTPPKQEPAQQPSTAPSTAPNQTAKEPNPAEVQKAKQTADQVIGNILNTPQVKESAAQQYRRLANILQELTTANHPVGTMVKHSNGLDYQWNGTEWRSVHPTDPALNNRRAPPRIINDLNTLATNSTPAPTASANTTPNTSTAPSKKTKMMGWEPTLGRPPEAGEVFKIPNNQPKKYGIFRGKDALTWDVGQARFTSTDPELDKLLRRTEYQQNYQKAFADFRQGGRLTDKIVKGGDAARDISRAADKAKPLLGKGINVGLRAVDLGYSIDSAIDNSKLASKNFGAGNTWTGWAYSAAALANAASAIAAIHPATKFTAGVGIAVGAAGLELLANWFEEKANEIAQKPDMSYAEKVQLKREYQAKIDALEKALSQQDWSAEDKQKFLAAINKLKQDIAQLQ